MRIRRSSLLAGLLCLVVAGGCTTVSQGSPRPADSTGSDSTSSGTPEPGGDDELPFAGAPKVDDPLDTDRYQQDPCLTLTAEQTRDLNLPATGKAMEDTALGVACEWKNESTRGVVQIYFAVDDPRGLSPDYEVNERNGWEHFEELADIEGFPAIVRMGTDDRDIGHCTVVVGVADDMSFESIVRLSESNVGVKDPCAAAADVAGMALQTMKEA